VGRDEQLAEVTAHTVAAPKRGLTATIVSGEAGIGKSMLMEAVLAELATAGWTTLIGRADVLEQRIPYAALVRVVAPLVAGASDDVAQSARELAASLDVLGGRAAADVEASFGQVCGGLTALVRALTERAPVALAIDDVDALDDDTLAALVIVARRLADAPFALLGTSRTEPVASPSRFGSLVDLLDAEDALLRMPLGPLDEHDVGAVAAQVLGASPDDDLLHELHRRTDGNPFFAVEIAASLREAALVDPDGQRGARLTGPMRLTRGDAVLRRLAPLEPTARAVLDTIAVLGRAGPADLTLVADATGIDVAEVAVVFDELVARKVMAPLDSTYAFTHDLVRDAIYDAIGPARQQLLHDAIACRLRADRAAGRPADLLALARHVSASASPGDATAAAVLAEAGDLTRGVAPGSAAALYKRALELAPGDDPGRPGLMARECRALSLAALPADAVAAGRPALDRLPAGAERARTANVVISALIEQGKLSEALAVADSEVAVSPASPVLVAQRASVLWNLQRFDEALAEGARADALPSASPAERLLTLGPLGLLAAYAGAPRPLLEVADEMLRIGATLPRTLELYSTAIASYSFATCGFLRLALAPLSRAEVLVEEVGGTAFRANILVSRVLVDWLQGRWDEAMEAIDRSSTERESAQYAVQDAALEAIDIEIRSWRGAQVSDRLLAHPGPVPNFADLRSWAVAGALATSGRVDEARAQFTEAEGRNRYEIAYRPMLLSRRIELELESGKGPLAAALLDDLEDDIQLRDNPWGMVLYHRSRALVHRDATIAQQAAALAADEGLVFEAARSQLAVAELSAGANEGLEAAYRTFQALGADGLRRRAGAALKAHGLKVPRQRRAGDGPLTEAELKIAHLVQEGLRNKEIASVLHYSPRTVEVYLSKIYAKMSVTSRLELARALDAHPLDG
jgi:DNA-binding CsgD family transcriptional regulator